MVKTVVLNFLKTKGYYLTTLQFFEKKKYGNIYIPKNNTFKINREIVETIINFYKNIKPFYSNDAKGPLKIGGIWKDIFLNKRKHQLDAIKREDVDAYENLLNNMFRNEIGISLNGVIQYDESPKKPLPVGFIALMDGFKFLTGRREEELAYCDFGNRWGYKTTNGVISGADPRHGIYAQQIINILRSYTSKKPVLVDLGSGFGGTVEKVARWYKKPLRILLIDLPLNLTTAYAYISAGFEKHKRCTFLIDSEEKLEEVLSDENQETEFIFIPTLFVEKLKELPINVLHNHGSFSEMDYETIKFYLQNLVNHNTDFLLEINSSIDVRKSDVFSEVPSTKFPIPSTHSLLTRAPTWGTPQGHRYLESLYINKRLLQHS